ncbi:MAG: dienelactone hydrolase family protein [Myxococcales bacterium]|nr:dienelactone hydrolase family protein [Myxococcales bacterium]
MSERVTFTSKNGDTVGGALALPAGAAPAPAVVVVQEWWGLNAQIEATVDRLAAEGFVALAPDLYRGAVARDATEANQMMTALDGQRAMADLEGAVAHLRAHPRGNGKVAITGFCMGGAYTFAAACFVRGLACAVPFYGVPPRPDWSQVDTPIQAHFASRDGWAKPDAAREIQRVLEGRGQTMELHVYDAEHAFMNERRPEVHAPEAAALAWSRAVAFLRQHTA